MNILDQDLINTLKDKKLTQHQQDFIEINQFFAEKCKGEFYTDNHGHIIISKLRFFIAINMNRMKFLNRSYIDQLNQLNPLSCNIILRSIVETSAAITYLFKSIIRINDEKSDTETKLKELEELPDKLTFGERNNHEAPNAVNVLTTVKTLDFFNEKYSICKDISFYDAYNHLSEISHPNFGGYLLNMVRTGKFTIEILDENRNFLEEDYSLKTFMEVNKIYRAAINYTEFIVDGLNK